MGLYELDATATNLALSLGTWLHGTFGEADSTLAAHTKIRQTVDDVESIVKQTWLDIFPTAPEPIVSSQGRDIESDLNERLLVGSPLLILQTPIISDGRSNYGGDGSYHQLATVSLAVVCAVWSDKRNRRLDVAATRQQLLVAKDTLLALFRWQTGAFPVYDKETLPAADATPPDDVPTIVGWSRLALQMPPVDRPDLFRSDMTLLVQTAVTSEPLS